MLATREKARKFTFHPTFPQLSFGKHKETGVDNPNDTDGRGSDRYGALDLASIMPEETVTAMHIHPALSLTYE